MELLGRELATLKDHIDRGAHPFEIEHVDTERTRVVVFYVREIQAIVPMLQQ